MNLLANLFSWVTGKGWGGAAVAPPSFYGESLRSTWSAPPKPGDDRLLALYEESIEFRTPVKRIADRFGSIPFGVIEAGATHTSLEGALLKHPLQAIIDHPQVGELAGNQQRSLEQVWLDIVDNAFFRLMWNDDLRRVEVFPLPPHWVRPVFDGTRRVYEVQAPNGRFVLSDEEVVWLKHPSAVDPYGRGVGNGRAAADDIQIAKYASNYTESFFYNSAAPDRVIGIGTKDGTPDPSVIKALQADWNNKFSGAKKAHGTHFIGGQLSVVELQTAFRDLEVTEQRKQSAKFIRSLYGVSPELVGELDSSNRATITEALAILSELVLIPAAEFRRTELNTKMLPRLEEMGVDVDGVELGYQDPTPPDRQRRLEVMEAQPEGFTVNEWRDLAGLPRRADGDIYLRQADYWEEVDAGDIIDITPIRRSVATPPPLPSPLSHIPDDQPIVRLIINQEVA